METTIYLRFYIKKSKTNKKGLTPIIMRVTLKGKRSEINIGRNVEPNKWSATTEKMMGRSIEANEINDFISLMRKKVKDVQKTFIEKGEAHLGGSFSMIEALLTLYEVIMKKKDKFILSKAHASFPLCILLQEKGLNPKLTTHLELDAKNGIHCTTGSLGHGLPIATGIAFAKKQHLRITILGS